MKVEFLNNKYPTSSFRLRKLKEIIKYIIDNEGYNLLSIVVYFVNEREIVHYNKKYLKHNYPTDIITFNYSEKRTFNAEMIVCIPVIKSNSLLFKKTFINELYRVVIHGILHVTGYNDKTKNQKITIRKKEDFYLKLFKVK